MVQNKTFKLARIQRLLCGSCSDHLLGGARSRLGVGVANNGKQKVYNNRHLKLEKAASVKKLNQRVDPILPMNPSKRSGWWSIASIFIRTVTTVTITCNSADGTRQNWWWAKSKLFSMNLSLKNIQFLLT